MDTTKDVFSCTHWTRKCKISHHNPLFHFYLRLHCNETNKKCNRALGVQQVSFRNKRNTICLEIWNESQFPGLCFVLFCLNIFYFITKHADIQQPHFRHVTMLKISEWLHQFTSEDYSLNATNESHTNAICLFLS